MIGNPEQQTDIFYTWSHDYEVVWDEAEGNGYKVYRAGEMKVYYTDPAGEEHTLRYTEDFIRAGLDTDDKVAEASDSFALVWVNNPWFEVAHDERNMDSVMDGEIYGNITEAVERAIHLGSCLHPTLREDKSCEDCYYIEENN